MSKSRRVSVLLLVAVLLPALACLAWTLALAPGTPEPETWRAARGDDGLLFTWVHFVHAPDPPRLALFRLAYMGFLFGPGSDFGRFGFVPWGLALGTVVALALLVRRTAGALRGGILPGIGLALFAGWVFSPGFGADWLVGARLGMFVPPLFLALGILLLSREACSGRRVVLAALLALMALFFHRTGVLVWMALLPLVVAHAPRGRRATRAAFWLILGNVATVACFLSPWAEEGTRRAGLVRHVLDDPLEVVRFVAGVAGDAVPRVGPGSGIERTAVGALLLAGLVGLLVRTFFATRNDVARKRRALPWAVLASFGAGCAFVLCDAHFGHVAPPPVLRELGWGSVFLPVGIVGIAVVRRGAIPRKVLIVGAVVLAPLLLQDWHRGWEHLKVRRAELHQAGALLVFAASLEGRLPAEVQPAILDQELSLLLRDMGRLRESAPLASSALSELDVGDPPDGPGELSEVTPSGVRGFVRATTFRPAADLVLVTSRRPGEAERILRVAAPRFSGGGKIFPWAAEIGSEIEPGDEVRAYGFHLRGRRTYPLAGTFVGEERP